MSAPALLPRKRRDPSPGTIAANLGGSRATARAIIAIPYETRVSLFEEVARVGARRVLAFTRTQPDADRP